MSNTATPANAKFLSALDLIDLNERDVYKKLFQRDPEAGFFDFFEQEQGRQTATANHVVEHYETGSIFERIEIASATAGSGTSIVAVLAASSHSADGKTSYVREQDVIELYNRAQYMVQVKDTTTAGAHKATLIPINANQTAAPLNLAGTFAWVVSNAWAAGTDQPGGINGTPEKFSNHTQIFKEAYVVDGEAESSKQIVEFPTPSGGSEYRAILKGELDTITRLRAKEHNAMLFGQLSDNGLVDKAGESLRTTRGLIPTVESLGFGVAYVNVTIDEIFKPITKQLDKRRACNEYMLRTAHDLNFALDRIVSKEMQELGLRYENIGGKEKAVLAGFDTFGISGYTFHKKKMDLLTHDRLAGASGSYDNFSVGIPMGFKKDPKSQKMLPQMAIRYKGNGAVSRAYKVWEEGSNASTPTNGMDIKKINYRSEKAIQIMGAADFFTLNK